MGGEPAGDVASISAVLGFESGFGVPPDEPEDNMRWVTRFLGGLRGALDGMADALARGDGADGMATTLAAVWAGPDGMRWLSVGDSGIWASDVFRSSAPTRLNARHGQGNRVDSGLMAAVAPFRAGSVEAEFCATAIDLHPGPLRLSPGRLILVGSDGMDVLGRVGTPGGWAEQGEARPAAEWDEAFRHMNPRDFLSRVESVLAVGLAEDNTTAIALRTPRQRSAHTEDYVPVSDAPEREVLGGDST